MRAWLHDDDCDVCRRGRRRATRVRRHRDWSWTIPYLVVVAAITAIAVANGLLGYGPRP
jgi:hypothetical protein